MIAYLTKSDAREGFNQIINFLNGSSIKYALTVNPNIYVSCIKQFWNSVAVKKVNDVTRLQALVDKKKVIIMEASIRDVLRLDDAEGIECLPNEELFAELARMGYENPSTKLTFYKAKQVGDLSSHSTKYTSPVLTQKVFANMKQVGKGFSGVETPLFEGMLVVQEVGKGDADEVHVGDVNAAGVAAEGVVSAAGDEVPTAVEEPSIPSSVENLEQDKIAQALEITELKSRVKKLERRNNASKLKRLKKVGLAQRIDTSDDIFMDDASKQRGIIANIDADEDVVLEDAKDVTVEKSDDVEDNVDTQGRKAVSQAEIYKIDLEHAKKVLSMQEEESEPAKLQEVVDVVITAKIITEVVTAAIDIITAADVLISAAIIAAAPTLTSAPKEPKPLKKQAQVEQDKKYARELKAELNKNIDWDEVINHVQRKQKEDNAVKRYTSSNLEKSKKCSWSSEGQELEAVRVLWCADHYIYYNTVDFVGREEISTHKVHSGSDAQ
nr:xylulose kinase-1 [Tanacetum cinerariifolium]